jgi:hypothetical protein
MHPPPLPIIFQAWVRVIQPQKVHSFHFTVFANDVYKINRTRYNAPPPVGVGENSTWENALTAAKVNGVSGLKK